VLLTRDCTAGLGDPTARFAHMNRIYERTLRRVRHNTKHMNSSGHVWANHLTIGGNNDNARGDGNRVDHAQQQRRAERAVPLVGKPTLESAISTGLFQSLLRYEYEVIDPGDGSGGGVSDSSGSNNSDSVEEASLVKDSDADDNNSVGRASPTDDSQLKSPIVFAAPKPVISDTTASSRLSDSTGVGTADRSVNGNGSSVHTPLSSLEALQLSPLVDNRSENPLAGSGQWHEADDVSLNGSSASSVVSIGSAEYLSADELVDDTRVLMRRSSSSNVDDIGEFTHPGLPAVETFIYHLNGICCLTCSNAHTTNILLLIFNTAMY
jgi:hypothetical protein